MSKTTFARRTEQISMMIMMVAMISMMIIMVILMMNLEVIRAIQEVFPKGWRSIQNTVYVLHQNVGGIGKSIPEARGKSRGWSGSENLDWLTVLKSILPCWWWENLHSLALIQLWRRQSGGVTLSLCVTPGLRAVTSYGQHRIDNKISWESWIPTCPSFN